VHTSRASRVVLGTLTALLAASALGAPAVAAEGPQLQVSIQGSGVPERDYNAFNGEILYYSISVSNQSTVPATGVTTTQVLPEESTFVSEGTDPRCSADGQVVTCQLGTVDAFVQIYYLVYTRANAAGSLTSTVTVSANEEDTFPENNTASTTTIVQPAAHLSIAVAESADPSRSGNPLTYTVTVTNEGPDPATANGYTDIAWEAFVRRNTLESWSSSSNVECTQTFSNHLGCDFGTLDVAESFSVTVTIRPVGKGTVELRVQAPTFEWPGGDSLTEVTTIRQGRR
jgi:uncharacterized repeat protein (TIGR01451 family)